MVVCVWRGVCVWRAGVCGGGRVCGGGAVVCVVCVGGGCVIGDAMS